MTSASTVRTFALIGMIASSAVACSSASFIPLDNPACVSSAQTIAVQEILFGVPLVDAPGPFASGGRVVAARNLGTTRNDRVEVYSLDPVTAEEQSLLRGGDYETTLLDAHGGATLFVRTPSGAGSGPRKLYYADARGERALYDLPQAANANDQLSFQPARNGAHLVMPGKAAAVIDGTLVYFDGESTSLVDASRGVRSAYVFEDGVVYNTPTGLYLWSRGQRTRLAESDDYFRQATAGAGQVFWRDRDGVTRYELATGTRTVLTPDTCWELSMDAGRLLFVCGTGSEAPWLGRSLRLFDGQRVRTVPTLGGLVGRVQLSGARAAWLEYEGLRVQEVATLARVVVWSDGTGAPRELARIGSPCHNCAHTYSPEPQLSLEGALVAWNYARAFGDALTSSEYQAYALLPGTCE